MAAYVHSVPGRLRVKVPEIRYRDDLCESVARKLDTQEGVQSVAVSPLTGSIKIRYHEAVTSEENLLGLLQHQGYYDPDRVDPSGAGLGAAAKRSSDAIGRALVSWAVGKALEANGLGLLAALI